MQDRPLSITITPGTIFMVVLVLVGAGLIFALRETLLIVFTAIVIASAIEPLVGYFMRYHIPRVASVVMIYLALLSLMGVMFYVVVPPLLSETVTFIETLPATLNALSGSLGAEATIDVEPVPPSLVESLRELQQMISPTVEGVMSVITRLFGGLLSFVFIVVLSFYFTAQERGISDFLKLVTPKPYQVYVLDLWRRSQWKIGRWLQGQIILSLFIAILVYIGMSFLGIRYPLLLAIAAGILELIPVFGSIIAAVPAIILAFIEGGTSLALVVVGYYILINQIQGNIIYPLVVTKIIGVPPVLVVLSIIIGGQLAGFWGIVLGVPIVAVLRELVLDLHEERAAPDTEEVVVLPTPEEQNASA
jgi:predicted PurR-regulated permease PerM